MLGYASHISKIDGITLLSMMQHSSSFVKIR